jgi:hypothetical protein
MARGLQMRFALFFFCPNGDERYDDQGHAGNGPA